MKTIFVTAYPYATQFGKILIPDDIDDKDVRDYLSEHFDEIKFEEPELDYCGCDFEVA